MRLLSNIYKVGYLLLALVFTVPLFADDVTVQKEDGKFSAKIYPATAFWGYNVPQNGAGFLKSVELDLQWWWLMGQPVYYHKLKWEIKDSIRVELMPQYQTFLARNDLRKYPDLLKRFDQLRPMKLEIAFDVILRQGRLLKKIGKFGTYFNNYNEFTYHRVVKDVTIMIARSGKIGDNISPGSPSFRDFTDNKIHITEGIDANYVEKRLAATFINTSEITFRAAHISRLELPNVEIKSIYDSYILRKKSCKREVNAQLQRCKKKQAKEKPKKSDDFWSNGGKEDPEAKPEPTTTIEGKDNFWSTGGTKEDNPTKKTKKIDRGFWKNGTSKKSEAAKDDFWSSGGNTNDGDEFWRNGEGAADVNGFKIEIKQGKQGVVSSEGRILIPFRAWVIESYKGGIAEIIQSENRSDTCKNTIGAYDFTVTATASGYVDQSGDWVLPPTKTLKYKQKKRKFTLPISIVLNSTDYRDRNLSAAEKARRDRRYKESKRKKAREAAKWRERREDELLECRRENRSEMMRVVNSYRSKGYK